MDDSHEQDHPSTRAVPSGQLITSDSETSWDSSEVEMQVIDDSTTSNDMPGLEPTNSVSLISPSVSSPFLGSPPTSSDPPESSSSPAPRSGMRRGRVHDDHDDERDRRHPSHRVVVGSSPQPSSSTTIPGAPSSVPTQPTPSSDRVRPDADVPGIFRIVTGRSGSSNPTSPIARPFRFFQHLIHPNHPNHGNSASPASAATGTSLSTPEAPDQLVSTPVAATNTPATIHDGISSSNAPRQDLQPNMNAPNPNPNHQYLGGFAITIDMLGGMTTAPFHPDSPINGATNNEPTAAPNAALPGGHAPLDEDVHPGAHPHAQATPGNGNDPATGNGNSAAAFAELLARIGLLAALGMPGFGLEREVEDPERARKLVEGLEEVPPGLIRRLERVGGTGGGMGHDMNDGGDSGCAICWEKLLGGTDESEPETQEQEQGTGDNDSPAPESKEHPKIVSLPCAHVFHAECLIPWFSRPRHTTCPTCRFNIDPENLTYTSRSQRRRAPDAQAQDQDNGQEVPMPTMDDEQTQAQAQGTPPAVAGNDATPDSPDAEGDEFGFPVFFGGFPPFFIPFRGDHDDPRPPPHPQTNTPIGQGPLPAQPTHVHGQTIPSVNANIANTNDNNTGDQRPPREFVTIGFDMYIGRAPPPPFPPQGSTPPTAMNTAPTTDSTGNAGSSPEPNQRPRQGGDNAGGNMFGFTLPLSLGGMGVGRTIGGVIQRVFEGVGGGRGAGGNEATGDAAQHSGEPVVFGPDRPPAPVAGSLPANVGLGLGNAQRQQGTAPMVLPLGFVPFPLPVPTPGARARELHPQQTPQQSQPQQQQEPQQPQPQPQPQQQPPQPQPGNGPQMFVGGLPIPFFELLGAALRSPLDTAHLHPHGPTAQETRPTPKKKWAPPPAPGLTLRQKVEKKEQEAGLRCCDVSCGVGPSDEDPCCDGIEQGVKQLNIWPPGTVHWNTDEPAPASDGTDQRHPVCPHTFHSSCLVSTERVALALRDAEVAFVGPDGGEVDVSCPVCRGVGRVSKEEWNAGVRALS